MAISLPRPPTESRALVVGESLHDILPRVAHERAVLHDRLVDVLALQNENFGRATWRGQCDVLVRLHFDLRMLLERLSIYSGCVTREEVDVPVKLWPALLCRRGRQRPTTTSR
eukprot:CAMPEP_0184391570 /NCGR_PEP_ID=MMETSP0007-20130409/14202_1 /TAXON_ID=97485 /ORGANISM="Prymnesium parvum, Strain Texoma1" /LENGTH=112 /DNA_ID=CAMNT_0026741737 /DNA_START=577 /DNA_END=915 /DNA_ORIENTATION=-